MSKDKSKVLYKQCKISRGNSHWVAWLPINLAIEGKIVVPKGSDPAIVEHVSHKITLTHEQIKYYYDKKINDGWDTVL